MNNYKNLNYRYERKFFILNQTRQDVETMIQFHPAFFREIYHERYINNIYFDYLELNNFSDNIVGSTQRFKHRIRWYGDLFAEIKRPTLELKIKEGVVGTKKSFLLNKFKLFDGMDIEAIQNLVLNSNIESSIKLAMQSQFPFMINRYKRKYFESLDKKFRFTVDDEQSFYKLNILNNSFLQKATDSKNVILELKYDKSNELEASAITNKIPFRITKSSKYAKGIELLYFFKS